MTIKHESWLVRSVKYVEINYHHLYKNYEALILFLLSAYCLADFTSLKDHLISLWKNIFHDTQPETSFYRIIYEILSSYPVYLLLFLFSISLLITKKIIKEAKIIGDENTNLKTQVQNNGLEISSTKIQLNEAEEAIDDLKDNNLKISFEIGSKFIAYLFQKWGLSSRERISLYLEIERHFILSARYSLDSNFEEVHRKQFPIDQGIIGECWRLGRRCLIHLPKSEVSYNKESIKQNFTQDQVKCFTMKSKSLIAFPISTENFEKIGVLVIESTRVDWNFDETSTLTNEYQVLFRQFLIHYEKIINACQREVSR